MSIPVPNLNALWKKPYSVYIWELWNFPICFWSLQRNFLVHALFIHQLILNSNDLYPEQNCISTEKQMFNLFCFWLNVVHCHFLLSKNIGHTVTIICLEKKIFFQEYNQAIPPGTLCTCYLVLNCCSASIFNFIF